MQTSEFISKLNDAALAQKMAAAKSPQEAYEIARTSGVTDSFEVFTAEMEKLKAYVGELSENDLASVAGGMGTAEATAIISGTVTIAAGSVAAASAAI